MFTKHNIAVSCALILSLFFALGCEKSDTSGPGGKTALAAVTNLQAYSSSATSVGLQWNISANDGIADMDDYMITTKTPAGAVVSITYTLQGENTIEITGLTEGVIYTFEVVVEAIEGSTNYDNSSGVTTTWSPARRLNDDNTSLPIKVYETSSSGSFGSGLIFYDVASSKPKIVSVSSPGSDALKIDAVLYTGASNSVTFKSASLYNGAWKLTRFSSIFRNASSLDDPRPTPPDTTTYLAGNTTIQFDSLALATSRIYYFKGDVGNYGRILVQRDPATGRLIWGTSPEQYLNLIISYQTVPYNRYSKTAPIH